MTPISHALIGWLIAQPLKDRRDRALVTMAALVCDLDGVSIVAGLDSYWKYHHTFGHNIFAGILTTGTCFVLGRSKPRAALLGFAAFNSHILADMLGSGAAWPIPYFWPVSNKMFSFGPPFQWELDSWQNLAITIVALGLVGFIGIKRQRTIIEVASTQLDTQVVQVFQKWAGKRS